MSYDIRVPGRVASDTKGIGEMAVMIETVRGTVNTWECDEMGHMNVRFYVARALEGVRSLLIELGLSAQALRDASLRVRPIEQHLRFHREIHAGHGFVLNGFLSAAHEGALDVYQEMWRTDDPILCATVLTRITLDGPHASGIPPEVLARSSSFLGTIPEHGRARGFALDTPRPSPTRELAESSGMVRAYRGVVGPMDIDDVQVMRTESFMGRISDGVVHFFQQLGALERSTEQGIGGAALEYRLVYRAQPKLHDVLETRVGLKAQNGKATHFVHWMFDAATGDCVMTSEAVAVLFDLKARKAIRPDPEVMARLTARANAELSV